MAKEALEKIIESEQEADKIILNAKEKSVQDKISKTDFASKQAENEIAKTKNEISIEIEKVKEDAKKQIDLSEQTINDECRELLETLSGQKNTLTEVLVDYIKNKR